MAYAPVPYTTQAEVETILRTSNNKITIGTDPGEIAPTDVAVFILQASKFIDGFVRSCVLSNKVPIPNYEEKPEITFAAPYLAAYFIHRALYASYRTDQLGAGITGFLADAKDHLEMFKEHVNAGVYPDCSPATGGVQFTTVEQYFQTQIGVEGVDRSLRSDQDNIVPLKLGNIGPFNDGSLQ